MKNNYQQNIHRKFNRRKRLVLTIYTVLYLTILALLYFFLTLQLWYPEDFLYQILKTIQTDFLFFVLLFYVIGFFLISRYYYRKMFNYIDILINSIDNIFEEYNLIELPVELKEIENRLNKLKNEYYRNVNEANEAISRKNDLIIYLAHDLKTPLTSIIGYLTILKEDNIPLANQKKMVDVVFDKSYRLEYLINEFFEITRFNLSSMVLSVAKVDLKLLLEQIIFEYEPNTKEKNIEIVLNCDNNILVRLDADKMQRAFENLIKNAYLYGYPDTKINIDVILEKEDIIISIRNKGITIPKEKIAYIFDQFYRVDSARSSQEGAGLGLAITKEIIEAHQGTISVESENEVTCFYIKLKS